MEDKRRRARVQGAWAGPAKSQAIAQPGKNLWGSRVCVWVSGQVSSYFIYIPLVYSGLPFQLMLRFESLLSLASAPTAENHLQQRPGQTWMNKEHRLSDRQFVFKEPQEVNSCFFFNSTKDLFIKATVT